MRDHDLLRTYLQDRHLSLETIAQYQDRFRSSELRVLVLPEFLRADVAERLARFLLNEAVFDRAYGLYSPDSVSGTVSGLTREEWLAAPTGRRFFRFGELAGGLAECESSPNLIAFREFVLALKSPAFKDYFEDVTGVGLQANPMVNAYAYTAGDFIGPHRDNNKNRRLAFVIYLTPEWRSEYGGELNVVGPGDSAIRVDAAYNALVLFDVAANTQHLVQPVAVEAPAPRTSLSGWFLDDTGRAART